MQFTELLAYLGEGFLRTLYLFFWTLVISLPMGMVVAILRMSKYKIISWPIRFYLLIMRGTPLILQLLFFMYLPAMVFGLRMDRNIVAITAFSVNYAAYFGEIYRSGIQSIPQGQYEAAKVLGFSPRQTFLRIILPQVIKRVLPPVESEWMVLVKDTALANSIAVVELFRNAQNVMSSSASVIPIVVAGGFYLAMGAVITLFFSIVEKKYDYYKG